MNFETEGDIWEYLEENSDECVRMDVDDPEATIWFSLLDGEEAVRFETPLLGTIPTESAGRDTDVSEYDHTALSVEEFPQ